MKIVELKIDDSIISGVDAVALVESPAIEQDFMAFNKRQLFEETFNDYPEAAVAAAKRGIELNAENDNKCATQVGKVRAQQLANRESISLDTIQRMRSFLIRQEGNFKLAQERKDYSACGYISYLLWGGPAALPWAEKKLRQAGQKFADVTKGEDVYLISCSATKKDYKCSAAELYESPLFKKSLEFALKNTEKDNVNILSAKYYLVDLERVIEPYDVTLNNMSASERKDWAKKVFNQIAQQYDLQYDKFMFLAGGAYTEYLLPKFKYKTDVLEGMRIGERMEYLDKFYVVTNNDSYAIKNNFSLVNPEETIIEELIRQEMAESAMGLSVGDYVSWTYAGRQEGSDRARGQIKSIRTQGEVNIPDTDVTLNASKDRPVALIELVDGKIVGQFVDNLRQIQKPDDFEIDVTGLPDYTDEASGSLVVKNEFAAQLEEKQMLIGPLMTPTKLIPRLDDDGNEYYAYFSAETIEKIAYKMMENKLIDSVNIEHDGDQKVDDVYLVETWLVKDSDNDKSRLYGFEPLKGQWFGIYKVKNKSVWDEYIKTGKVKGFSVEGYFSQIILNK